MQPPSVVPVLHPTSASDAIGAYGAGPKNPVLDEFVADLAIAYSFGPPYGSRLATGEDLANLQLPLPNLRRLAIENLYQRLDLVEIHGQPPVFIVSFDGIESSLLLTDDLWYRLAASVPGELVVAVPARDVLIVTGSGSSHGLRKCRRARDRVFFAAGGHQQLLTEHLLVRREDSWEVL